MSTTSGYLELFRNLILVQEELQRDGDIRVLIYSLGVATRIQSSVHVLELDCQ